MAELTNKEVEEALERMRLKPKNVFDINVKIGKVTKRKKRR